MTLGVTISTCEFGEGTQIFSLQHWTKLLKERGQQKYPKKEEEKKKELRKKRTDYQRYMRQKSKVLTYI